MLIDARSGQQISISYPYTMTSKQDDKPAPQAVRFTSQPNEEIEPAESLQHVETIMAPDKRERDDLGPEAQEELKNLAMTLQKSRQQRRLENFQFEPVSLPPSRVSNLWLPSA